MDGAISKAVDKFLEGGASTGLALSLLFACAIVWLVNKLLKSQDALVAAKDAHREDVTKYAIMSEALKNAMTSQTEAMKTLMEAYKEKSR